MYAVNMVTAQQFLYIYSCIKSLNGFVVRKIPNNNLAKMNLSFVFPIRQRVVDLPALIIKCVLIKFR